MKTIVLFKVVKLVGELGFEGRNIYFWVLISKIFKMTNEQIKASIETNELKLSFGDKFAHYFIIVFLLFMPMFLISSKIYDYFKGISNPIEGEIWFIIIPTALAPFAYVLQRNRLKFLVVESNLPKEEIHRIIEKVAKELEWKIFKQNEKMVLATTSPSFFSGSWGELITILFDKNRILVNSICDPGKKTSLVSWGRNKNNMLWLIDDINKANQLISQIS